MANDLEGLADRLEQRANNLPARAGKVIRKAILSVHSALVITTPVDTGAAKSNFTITLRGPESGAFRPFVPGRFGSTAAANISAALQDAHARLSGRTDVLVEVPVYITNALDYIVDLNRGKSPQAPPFYVQRAILLGVQAVRRSGIRVVAYSLSGVNQ